MEIWDPARHRRLASFTGGDGPVPVAVFSPDGQFLATAGDDPAITVWRVSTGTRWATLAGHTGPVTTLAWNLDGGSLVTGSRDHTITTWTIDTRQAVRRLCDTLARDYLPQPRAPDLCRTVAGSAASPGPR